VSDTCPAVSPEHAEESSPLPSQTADLLRTKFHIPPARPTLVDRPRLFEMLERSADKPVILVSAPAGYGKSTLVSGWLEKTRRPAAWFSSDDGDNDPVRFLQGLMTVLRPVVPALGDDLPDMLRGIQPAQFETLETYWINALAVNPAPFMLVLDDVHVLHSPPVLKILSLLMESIALPAQLVLLTRIDPPLPLARLRARARIADIRIDQLRFTPDEIAVFLNEKMGLNRPADDIAALAARTEGWIAGLQLAALSMQNSRDVRGFVAAFTGSHHYIVDYLVEEVLNVQPPDVVTFLLQTSILDRLCQPLCDSLLGEDAARSAGRPAMLESLERMGLFVIPLDDERRWYRYHHLFADVLRKHLQDRFPQTVPALHTRASQWYEHNDLAADAVRHALQAGEPDRAARLIEDNGCQLIISGEVATLSQWLKLLEFQAETRPWLAIQKAWALALTGEYDRVEPTLLLPERLIAPMESSPEVDTMRGTIAAARAYCANSRGDPQSAAEYARRALDLLPESIELARSLRSVSTSILGDASWINGDLDQAGRVYLQAVRLGREAGNLPMVVIANANLAELLIERGRLRRAAEVCTESLQTAVRPDGQRSPLAGGLYAFLGWIALECNRLDEAESFVRQSLDICRRWGDVGHQALALATMARLEQARGRREETAAALREAERLADEHPVSPNYLRRVEAARVRACLARGDAEWPSRLAERKGWTTDGEIPFPSAPDYLTFARVLLARREHDAVIRLCGRLLRQAEPAGRMGVAIEASILQSLAHQAKKEADHAVESLADALALAKPEGYVRVFLDEGEPMTRLLVLAQSRQSGSGYASELLSAVGGAAEMTQPSMELLSEPLTARELEVLKLIEAGCSNQEISEKFVISMPTVKRHISNIYSKLGVKSRTQAIAIGKELKLFG